MFGGWLVTEHEDVYERRNRRGERDGEDDGESAEQDSDDCDREERDERREPDGLPDVGVDDVALELPDEDEPEQGERGDVQGLRESDGPRTRIEPISGPMIGPSRSGPTNAPTSS